MAQDRNPNTKYGVYCEIHGVQGMSYEEYMRQLVQADSLWKCPISGCLARAEFDDGRYEAAS